MSDERALLLRTAELAANYLDETGILRTERAPKDGDAGQLGLFGDDDD